MAKKVSRYRAIQEKTYTFVLNKMKLSKKKSLYWDIKDMMDGTDCFWSSSFDEFYNFSGRDNRKRIVKRSDYAEELFAIAEEMIDDVYYKIVDYYGDRMNFDSGYKTPTLPESLKVSYEEISKFLKTL